jgi:hypothetical protein|tara:strand:+ start:279 stop:464 length:186 start_codon:yes stop_codon:yes gene_type:complete
MSHKKKYCNVCKEKHYAGEEYDIFDCWNYERQKNPKDDSDVEIWIDGKWVNRKKYYEMLQV